MTVANVRYAPLAHRIGNSAVGGEETIEVVSPIDGETLSTVPMGDAAMLDRAVAAAQAAQPAWAALTLRERCQIFYAYRNLLIQHRDELALLASEENGKTVPEAAAEVNKAIEAVEFACSLPHTAGGQVQEVSRGIECRLDRLPMGVVASIAPFNFPIMVPHWTIPLALALGNAMILKPSELVPLSANRIGELLNEAGLPDGIFSVVHGGQVIVEAICDHPGIPVLSFVGSTRVAKIVYQRGSANLKNVLAMGGAKNHLVVLPDAAVETTATNIVVSMAGCAGQRCMAASVMVGVGDVDAIIARVVELSSAITLGKDVGAVISCAAKARILSYIDLAEKEGATIRLDGRQSLVAGKENGFYVGLTVLDHVNPESRIAKEEIFGPVLTIIRAKDIDAAVAIQNASEYGNASAVFTQSGRFARELMDRTTAGMVGVNIGVPVPRDPFSFGGSNDSKFGVTDITGESAIAHWTRLRKTTITWG